MGNNNLFTSLKITCNGYHVIHSGTIIAYSKRGTIEFNVHEFTLKMNFQENESKKQYIELENSPFNEIVLICYNLVADL